MFCTIQKIIIIKGVRLVLIVDIIKEFKDDDKFHFVMMF